MKRKKKGVYEREQERINNPKITIKTLRITVITATITTTETDEVN